MSDLEFNLIHRFNVGDALRRSAARSPSSAPYTSWDAS